MEDGKKVQCPKCGSKTLLLVENWNNGIQFEYNDGLVHHEGVMVEGAPLSVEASCQDCEHTWKLRGVTQIREIASRPDVGSWWDS